MNIAEHAQKITADKRMRFEAKTGNLKRCIPFQFFQYNSLSVLLEVLAVIADAVRQPQAIKSR